MRWRFSWLWVLAVAAGCDMQQQAADQPPATAASRAATAAGAAATQPPRAPSSAVAAKPPSPPGSAAERAACASPLLPEPPAEGLDFMDCNPKLPVQRDYPECYLYQITKIAGSAEACPPTHVELVISGGPGLLEAYRVRVEPDPPGEALTLILDDKNPPASTTAKAGSVIATVTVKDGRATGLRATRHLPAFNRGKLLPAD